MNGKMQADINRLLKVGFEALATGKLSEAGGACRKVLALDRSCVQGHFLVGLVAAEMKDYRTAVKAFGSVTNLDVQHAAAWAQLARIYMLLGQPIRAESSLKKAEEAEPSDCHVFDVMGLVYSQLGDQRSAIGWYQKAVEHGPDFPAFAINLSSALIFQGETAQARGVLVDTIKRFSDVPQAHWLLSSIEKGTDIGRAAYLLEMAENISEPAAVPFYAYAAGKQYEDLENWPSAFKAFEIGAKARKAITPFDEAADEALFRALEETFTEKWMIDLQEGHDDPAPIFIIGQPRTGTTLLERIITSHSEVEAAGELQQFSLASFRVSGGVEQGRWSPEAIAAYGKADPKAIGTEYIRASAPMRHGSARFVDKLPGNYLLAPLIAKALPQARIVHLVRNPMDSCFSSYKQLFADAYLHSYDQKEMARHYIRYYNLLAQWRRILPGRILDVAYEELVDDVEANARRVINFLGLGWQEACLSFHKQPAPVATASAAQVREKAHNRSVNRWKKYSAELAPMYGELVNAGLVQG
mgnify:CR=1 FL=1